MLDTPKVSLHPTRRIDVAPGNGSDLNQVVRDFKRDHGISFVLAFSGGADDNSGIVNEMKRMIREDASLPEDVRSRVEKTTEAAKDAFVASLVRDTLENLCDYRIAVLTGGTAWGVPRIATQVARELGFPTIGVFPSTAAAKQKNMLPDGQLSLAICVHPNFGESEWGDESPVYTALLDAVAVIGGGAGTMVETAHILKTNEKRKPVRDILMGNQGDDSREKLRSRPKVILPMNGTGGTAEKLVFFPGKPETMAYTIPPIPFPNGKAVADYLKGHVLFDEDMRET
ncbi:MAG TPA: hypothetical protein VHD38_01865 [Candidatus Paceibacterota bacterium]|nr:hypothetical protein [Candidatus Paceibacterota bacterium]